MLVYQRVTITCFRKEKKKRAGVHPSRNCWLHQVFCQPTELWLSASSPSTTTLALAPLHATNGPPMWEQPIFDRPQIESIKNTWEINIDRLMNSMCWIPWWSATIFWPSTSIESMMKLKGSLITNSFHMNRRCRKPKFAIWNGCVQNCVAPPWHFRAEMSPSACKFCLLRTLKKRFPKIKCVLCVCVCHFPFLKVKHVIFYLHGSWSSSE